MNNLEDSRHEFKSNGEFGVVTNPIVKRPTLQPYRQTRSLYIVVRSAFTLFTSHSAITDGEEGGALVCSLAWLNCE